MVTQEVKRKLTAILSADVKGYSRLMGADEEGTLQTLTAYREAMAELILGHRGRVVNAPGDALLAEFESVVDAVKSAVEIQRELTKRNAKLPTDRRMEYRMVSTWEMLWLKENLSMEMELTSQQGSRV